MFITFDTCDATLSLYRPDSRTASKYRNMVSSPPSISCSDHALDYCRYIVCSDCPRHTIDFGYVVFSFRARRQNTCLAPFFLFFPIYVYRMMLSMLRLITMSQTILVRYIKGRNSRSDWHAKNAKDQGFLHEAISDPHYLRDRHHPWNLV